MPILNTRYFGSIEYDETSVLRFPAGLPGFDDQHLFLVLSPPDTAPVVFLQSLSQAGLRLPAVSVHLVDAVYELMVNEDDLAVLGLRVDRQPDIGNDVLCLAVVTARHDSVSCNLLAPIVVNLKTGCALQAIRTDAAYSHEHSLTAGPACW